MAKVRRKIIQNHLREREREREREGERGREGGERGRDSPIAKELKTTQVITEHNFLMQSFKPSFESLKKMSNFPASRY